MLLIKADNDVGRAAMVQPDTFRLPDGTEITARFMVFSGGDGPFGTAHLSDGLSGFADDGAVVVYVSEGFNLNDRSAIIELREPVHEDDFDSKLLGVSPLGPGCPEPVFPVR